MKRFAFYYEELIEDKNGQWVKYEDMAPLEARVKELEFSNNLALNQLRFQVQGAAGMANKIKELEAENQRLKSSANGVYEKYKHLDHLLSDRDWLPTDFQGKILADLWTVIKAQLEGR